jgi:hypothetical protein
MNERKNGADRAFRCARSGAESGSAHVRSRWASGMSACAVPPGSLAVRPPGIAFLLVGREKTGRPNPHWCAGRRQARCSAGYKNAAHVKLDRELDALVVPACIVKGLCIGGEGQ